MPSTIGIVASGEDVLNDAVFWVDAGRSSVVSGALSNLGTGGSALNAVFGNSTGVDSFDPALLAHTGTNYLYLPGASANDNVSAPSIAAYNIGGDLEAEIDLAFTTLAPASDTYLLGRGTADPNRSWAFSLTSGGLLKLRWYPTGSAASLLTATSSVSLASVGIVAGQRVIVKVTLDVDNGAGGCQVRFWYSTNNGSSFSELGASPPPGVGTTGLPTVTANLVFNTSLGGTNLDAKLYRGAVRNGIGGTAVFDADFTTGITSGSQTTFTESSVNAATVTINRSTSGRKAVAVTRPILLFGTDDYLEVADNDLLDFGASEPFTVAIVTRQWNTITSQGVAIAKKTGNGTSGTGWLIRNGVGTPADTVFDTYDGTTATNRTAPTSKTSGALSVITGIASSSQLTAYFNNTASAATTRQAGSYANSEVMRIGRLSGAGTQYTDMELVAAAVWRRALNANEIATIVARYT